MKKLVVSLLCAIMLVSIFASSALAVEDLTNYRFGYTGLTDGVTLTYDGTNEHQKGSSSTIIEVRHNVIGSGSSAGYTNWMCGHYDDQQMYLGGKWQAPNGIYYSCTSSNFWEGEFYSVGGRANTKYYEDASLRLTSVRMEGQYRVH